MNFNLDDPLGDILSDGSNDSFFETAPKKQSSTSKAGTSTPGKAQTPVAAGKMEDIFGIKDITGPAINPNKDSQKFSYTSEVIPTKKPFEQPKPAAISSALKSQASFNDDDLISDLGFDPKKPKTPKSSILDDILGPIEMKKSSNPPQRPATTGGIGKEEPKIISRQSTETTESTVPGTYTASLPRPKTAGRRQSGTSLNDPLGLFNLPSKEKEAPPKEMKDTPKLKRKGTTADWLGLEPEIKPESRPAVLAPEPTPQTDPKIQIPVPLPSTISLPQTLTHLSAPNQNALLLAGVNMEAQSTMQTLQQQENQVLMATQMKNQEIALLGMQQKQQQFLAQQEMLFNDLLQKQVLRQNQLETTIRSQQDRINAHIQLMMAQPTLPLPPQQMEDVKMMGGEQKQQNDDIELKAEVKRLELENLRLEDLLSNVNSNHEKEIQFIESSHSKQLNVLEENFQNIEARLKDEMKNLESFFGKKLNTVDAEKQALIAAYEAKVNEIENDRDSTIKRFKINHESELESLRVEYRNMINNIRESKLLEFSVMQENTSYLQTLRNASSHLENVSGDIQTLRDDLYTKIDLDHKERVSKIEAREKAVEDKERLLKITQESSEQERIRLIDLVATLEAQLSKLSRDSSEEQWTLRQKMSSLEAERSNFEKEKQFAREQIIREEKRIEESKQLQLDENQRLVQQLQDERQLIRVEKAKLETAKKLQQTIVVQSSTTEVDTALKVAQDAARQADLERERYFKMQRELEAKKREVIEEENNLRQKQDELESTICATKMKERHAEVSLQRARAAEQNFSVKMQMLYAQLRRIAEREAIITQDRLEVSRERMELQEFKKKLQQTKCSLCRIGEKSTEISKILTRDNNENIIQTALTSNPYYNPVDAIFDADVAQSLKKMDYLTVNLTADFDNNVLGEIKQAEIRSPRVPNNLDAEITQLNHDIQKNVRD